MKSVIYGQNERVIQWVTDRIAHTDAVLGNVGIGLEEDGELIAGMVYGNYTPVSICMHVAAAPGKRWANREFLYRMFAYPFLQLGVQRITGIIREDNDDSLRFAEQIGCTQEGVMRKACPDGTNLVIYGMLKDECRWIGGRPWAQ
jgi:RimJ/RimL family protein N-acetyltransferase